MKAHIGVDADSGLMHSVSTPPANEPDVEEVALLLHGKEQVAHGDAGYAGADKRLVRKGAQWQIAAKRGRIKAMPDGAVKRALERLERRKANIRARVEHPFRVIKRQFGLLSVRFRGPGQEHGACHHSLCAIEPVDGPSKTDRHCRGGTSAGRQRGRNRCEIDPLRARYGDRFAA